MNKKEIREIRRHLKPDRSNITAIFGCYVSASGEVISEYRAGFGTMSENQREFYLGILKNNLSGNLGKNLIQISFSNEQLVTSPEYKLLMGLRDCKLEDESLRKEFFQRIIDAVNLDSSYLILVACDQYDVPFQHHRRRGRPVYGAEIEEDADEVYSFLMCSICPVKTLQPAMQYSPDSKQFELVSNRQYLGVQTAGFLFPSFEDRSADVSKVVFYTKDSSKAHEELIRNLFSVEAKMSAAQEKKTFETVLSDSLQDECRLEVIQGIHAEIGQMIQLQKDVAPNEWMTMGLDDMEKILEKNGVTEKSRMQFRSDFVSNFGKDAQITPRNVIDENRFEVKTNEITIRLTPENANMLRVKKIDGVPYFVISTSDPVNVNGLCVGVSEAEGKDLQDLLAGIPTPESNQTHAPASSDDPSDFPAFAMPAADDSLTQAEELASPDTI